MAIMVLEDLRDRFDEVLSDLEAAAGWQTSRVQRPLVILGRLDGIMTGIRQLRRLRPLQHEVISGLRVPTIAEMARIKAWLLATRNTVRDYLDTVVLLERLGEDNGALLRPVRRIDGVSASFPGWLQLVIAAALSPSRPCADRLKSATTEACRWPVTEYWSRYLSRRGRHWAAILAGGQLGEPQ